VRLVGLVSVATITRACGRLRNRALRVSPLAVLWLGGAAVTASLIGVVGTAPATGLVVDEIQQVAAAVAAVVALLLAARTAPPARRFVAHGLALSIGLVGVGSIVWDLQPGSWSEGAGPGDALFAVALVILIVVLARAIFGGMERSRIGETALDTAILLVASATVLALIWQTILDPTGRNQQGATAVACSLIAIAGPAAAFLALLHRGLQPRWHGAYALLVGVTLVGLAMVMWQTLAAAGLGSNVGPTDYMYPTGLLLAAYGGATWDLSVAPASRFARLAQAAVDTFPVLAVAVCVAILLLARRTNGFGVVELGSGGVVLLALGRQVLLTVAERRARTAERDASARLEREIRTRATVLRSLARLDAADTPEETARRICAEALRLDGIDHAVVRAFHANGDAIIVGVAGIGGTPDDVGTTLSVDRTKQLVQNAAAGPWTETFGPSGDPRLASLYAAGLRIMANAPLLWNERIVGVIGLGGTAEAWGPVVAERLATVGEFGVVAGALLGPPLAEWARLQALHESMSRVINGLAFHPVFQPIVDLATERTVGYEALTRFDDGERPDLCFANAAAVGLGIPLESACLRAAQHDAIALPAGAWLSLNVSPALAIAQLPLIAALESSERDLVLEITEHAQIASYAGLMAALDCLRSHARIAVDDAGVGYSGLQHILEIRPDIVKLDIALVRGVDGDPVRRALISSMVLFAVEAGSTLLAEGIETAAELATLRALGVPLGQGFLLGRPAPIEAIVAAENRAA
jgi:EAL domain-containing protein (putative c-di-GMP-specific phosphodiesterase class I)